MDSEGTNPAPAAPAAPKGAVNLFIPGNHEQPTEADFENAIYGTANPGTLAALVPIGTQNVYGAGDRTPAGGFKFQWTSGAKAWTVRGHGPDTNAPEGSTAQDQWTFRVEHQNAVGPRGPVKFLTSRDAPTGQGGTGPPTRWLNGGRAELTHIPLVGNLPRPPR